LSSVSHDLRTPLAVITGSASALVEGGGSMDAATQRDLTKTILEEAERLNHLIRNLLDMTRLESGAIHVNKEWLLLEEIVGAALNRMDTRLAGRDVRVELPPELPLVSCDAVLIEQLFINLLENAAKYADGPIEIRVTPLSGELMIEVADRGPGIPPGEEARVFEKFHRAAREGGVGGVGLGLAICRAIVAAHGGRIWAGNREGGGASFRWTLPFEGKAPELPPQESVALASKRGTA
jgi:two-component system sensor histidine kinase KdpD